MSTPETRRPSSAELVAQVASAALTRQASPPEHSVTISRNAKGVAQFEVTVRGTNLVTVESQARAVYENLDDAYPYPETNGGTT